LRKRGYMTLSGVTEEWRMHLKLEAVKRNLTMGELVKAALAEYLERHPVPEVKSFA